jgi:carotenoid 1,2-hydratase
MGNDSHEPLYFLCPPFLSGLIGTEFTMRQSTPIPDGTVNAFRGGTVFMDATPSAGMAGLDSHTAQQRWADEAQHALKTPGAYEWWYFQAISPLGDGVIFAVFQGLPFRSPYLGTRRSSASGLEKRGGVAGAPAPAAYMAVYQAGKKAAQFLNVYPPDSDAGAESEIRIGPNRITFRQDGSIGIIAKGYPYDVARGRPRPRPDQILSAQLTFTPTFSTIPHSRPFRAPNANGAMHHWNLASPHGKLTGSVQVLDTRENISVHDLQISTLGYHDHVYGHGDLADGIHKQLWGFLQGETWTAAWHQTIYKHHTGLANGLMLFEQGRNPVIVESPESKFDQLRVGRWLTRHPGRISMHGSDEKGHPVELLITHDGMLDGAPFHTGLSAKGTLTIPGRGSYTGIGATHLLQLRRLRWPILSDVTLLAITLVQRDDPLWRQ